MWDPHRPIAPPISWSARSEPRRGARSLAAVALALAVVGGVVGCGPEDDSAERSPYGLPSSVERWRSLVEKYFKRQNVTWGLYIIKCESGGNPKAYNASSGASGLFQHLRRYWPSRARGAGFAGKSPFFAEANIAAAAKLLYGGGGTRAWSCKHSPFNDFGYKPRYYDNGKPVSSKAPASSCKALPSKGGVIDEEGNCFDMYGPTKYWRSVSGSGHGGGLLWTNATRRATAANWARWRIRLAAGGKYRLKYYAVSRYAMFRTTRYVVRHGKTTTTLTVDQSSGAAGWRTLGTFSFAKGGDQQLSVYDNTSAHVANGQHIIADAIKLERVVASKPPSKQPAPPSSPSSPSSGGSSGSASDAKAGGGSDAGIGGSTDAGAGSSAAPVGSTADGSAGGYPAAAQARPEQPGSSGRYTIVGTCSAATGVDLGDSTLSLLMLGLWWIRRRKTARAG